MNLKQPVLLLTFNRLDTTLLVLERIKLYEPEKIYIVSDGPRLNKTGELESIQFIRKSLLDYISWNCEIKTLFRQQNKGCGYGVANGISWFFENEEMGIILEDDCLPDLSFFDFCNELLIRYQYNDKIKFIGGNNFQNGICRGNGSYYFSKYPASWGWASWRRVWKNFQIDLSDVKNIFRSGSLDTIFISKQEKKHWFNSFIKANKEKNAVWDFQFYYSIWSVSGICITPNKNLVVNLGLKDNSGTHFFLKDSVKLNPVCEEMAFPLIHPQLIQIDIEADKYTYDNFYSHSLARAIRILRENTWKDILKYVCHYYLKIR